MLNRIDEDLWVAHLPDFRFMGLRLGTRMTAVRLSSGAVWLHSPIPVEGGLREAIDALGPVRHIVCPNLYHHVFAGRLVAAYPEAEVYGPTALRKKRADLTLHHSLESLSQDAFGGELVPVPIEGTLLGETAFVHTSTRSIVSADLTENFETSPHLPTRLYLKLAGIHGKPGVSRLLYPMFRDRAATRRSVDRLLAHEPKRAVIAHGETIVEGDVRAVLEASYRFLG